MRIVVIGTGGLGGYFGGLLAKAGHDVTFLARGEHLRALQSSGLKVKSVHGDFHLPVVHASDTLRDEPPADLVLFTVKAYSLDEAAQAMLPVIGPHTAVLPLLNGIDAADRLARHVPRSSVLGGLCYTEAAIRGPGEIFQGSQARRIVVGELDGRITPRVEQIVQTLSATGATAEATTDVVKALWTKFVFIASLGGVCAAARCTLGELLRTPETAALFRAAMTEVEQVARARGIPLDPDVVERHYAFTQGFAPEAKPSLLRDLERGNRLEIDALSGAVVAAGQSVGVKTPIHETLYALLKPADERAKTS